MNMNELATAARYNIPVIEVVINNHVLGMVRQWQTLVLRTNAIRHTILERQGGFRESWRKPWALKAIRVTKQEEFGPTLRKAMERGRPVVIDCIIDKDDKVFPMVPAGAAIEEVFDQDDLK